MEGDDRRDCRVPAVHWGVQCLVGGSGGCGVPDVHWGFHCRWDYRVLHLEAQWVRGQFRAVQGS